MDQRNNEKPKEKDQVNKPTIAKRTKHIIKLKQENNDCFEIIIKKGNIVLSLD
jgi:hypothetical protein